MLKRIGLTRKNAPMDEQDRRDGAQKHRHWRVRQCFMDASCFVFLEETVIATNMTRRYGRGREDSEWSMLCLMGTR